VSGHHITAFIDLSGLGAAAVALALEGLTRRDRLGGITPHALVHVPAGASGLPEGWVVPGTDSATQACAWAFDRAAAADLPLLIVAAGAAPSADAIGAMLEALTVDPLFGVAVPRFAETAPDRIALHEAFGPGTATAPRRILGSLRDYQILAECVAPCLLIRRELVGNLSCVQGPSLWATLLDYVLRARRAGFRPVRCNRVVVSLDATGAWGCTAAEVARTVAEHGEADGTPPPDMRAPRGERLLACAVDAPRSLVIDARNLTPVFNGTSAAILGACEGLHRQRPESAVTLWLHPDAATVHAVGARFREWTIATSAPEGPFAAGLRLSQPWAGSDLDSLRDRAAVNAFWMLDTIAWDIGYTAPPDLDHTWQRLAAEADGILFISEFSRARFAHRFTVGDDVVAATCPLSLDPHDYALPTADGPSPPFWLVVGNRYDHKHVGPTVDLLARAFPTRNLVVFGDRHQPRAARVTRFTSGRVEDAVVRGCFARADVVIFPSFYEGFGLPVFEGLSYDRTVVVRDSALVRELAPRYRGPGRLFVYSTERELVDLLGRLDRGDTAGSLDLAPRDRRDVWNWDACGAMMLQTLDALIAGAPSPQMLRRNGLARGLSDPHREVRCTG
jgi:glycosyltransferase involved in cell wall biosynthesis